MNKEYWLTRDKYGDYSLFDEEPTLDDDGCYRSNHGCLTCIFIKDAGLNIGEKIKLVNYGNRK